MDIWDSNSASDPFIRSGVIGTSYIGGICGRNKYSILEYEGLNSIHNAAHELGHKWKFLSWKFRYPYALILSLGAVHDGTGSAILCYPSINNIMTSRFGSYSNGTNLFYFSQCSINSFKNTLLTTDKKLIL